MNDYQLLYRKNVEYAYLLIVYEDLVSSSRATPHILYAFKVEKSSGSGILKKNHAPIIAHNMFGSDFCQHYINSGWEDITESEELYPWAVKSWIASNIKTKIRSEPGKRLQGKFRLYHLISTFKT